MTKPLLLAACVVVLLSLDAAPRAKADTGFAFTGKQFVDTCPENIRECRAYVAGAVDAFETARTWHKAPPCIPINTTADQLVDIVTRYIKLHANWGQLPAGGLIMNAIEEAFDCSGF
jgi:hypothetical protein